MSTSSVTEAARLNRAYALLEIKAIGDEERVITGVATTPEPDRIGDIIEPLGVKFKNPLPLLHQHDSDRPVGTVTFDKPTADGITFTARLPKITEPGPLRDRIEVAWGEIRAGLVRAVSIGFRVLDDAFEFMQGGGIRFQKIEVLELSLVTVPANAAAVISTIKSIDAELLAASGQKQNGTRANPPGVSGPKPVKLRPEEAGTMSKTIAEQITALEATRAAKSARMEEVLKASIEEGRSTDQSEQDEFDTLEREVEAIDADLKRFRALQKAQAATAKAVDGGTTEAATLSRTGISIKQPKLEPGIAFARYAMVLSAAKGDITLASHIAENKFGGDAVLNTVMKAAVAAGTTTDPSWAGALVEYNTLASDFIDYLRAQTIIGQFGQNGVPALNRVPFNVHIKGQHTGGAAAWVGEGWAKPVTSFDYFDVYLGWAKVAAISVITEELARFSSPGAETLVRNGLAEAVIAKIDTDFIDPAKAAGTGQTASPASITNGVTPIASSGTDVDAIRQDIASLWSVADAANLPVSSAVYITDSRTARQLMMARNLIGGREFGEVTMRGGTLDGVPVIVSNYVPTDAGSPTVPGSLFILVFANEIFLADDGMVTLSASREASIQMDNAPSMTTSDGASPPAPAAAQVVSMYQTNSIALRAERYINWAKRRAQAVAYLEGVNWVASGGGSPLA